MTWVKKHKRGARGSTKEDTSKRANMAASEDMQDYQELATEEAAIIEIKSTATETSLEELKEMLVDIQINIANIFQENKSIRNEMAELTTTVQKQKLEITHLKTSLSKIAKQCSDASTNNKTKYMNYMSYRTDWNNTRGKILLKYMVCQSAHTVRQRRYR